MVPPGRDPNYRYHSSDRIRNKDKCSFIGASASRPQYAMIEAVGKLRALRREGPREKASKYPLLAARTSLWGRYKRTLHARKLPLDTRVNALDAKRLQERSGTTQIEATGA
jgi:hypothetical protein